MVSVVAVVVLAVAGFSFWYLSHYSLHAITATNSCLDIFKQKATDYFSDLGKSRFVFNKKMNSCLVLNTYDDTATGEYRLILADMISDKILFYYTLPKDQEKDATLGLTKDQAVDKARSYGFVIL